MTRVITKSGSVRVDLLGGTLDLDPINLIIPKVVTLNFATSLKAKAKLESNQEDGIRITSLDYKEEKFFTSEIIKNNESSYFNELSFVIEIFKFFKVFSGVNCELSSGSPPGAGLGGSSAMGMTLFNALSQWCECKYDDPVKIVKAIEASILRAGPTGYQDYYPALYGGILSLRPNYDGVNVKQLYTTELAQFLEDHLILINSNESRNSGINNWSVFKKFFDESSSGLTEIAEISFAGLGAIESKDYQEFLNIICKEGQTRQKLFNKIYTEKMMNLINTLKSQGMIKGAKVCGAGGGGCFILVHDNTNKESIVNEVLRSGMEVLNFKIDQPSSSESIP